MSKTVAVAEFEAHSVALLQEVAQSQEEVVIVDDGKPLARIVPAVSLEELRRPALERLRGSIQINGDITEPLDDEWDSMK